MKKDVQATAAKRFKDTDSYVAKDGCEVLSGIDWDDRRFELLQRSHGICENHIIRDGVAVRCTREAADPHHIRLRSIRRDDRMSNLLAVCRSCHYFLDRQQRKIHGKNKIHFNPEAAA